MPKKLFLPLEIVDIIVALFPPYIASRLSMRYFEAHKKGLGLKRADDFNLLWGRAHASPPPKLSDFSALPLVSNFISLNQGITISVCIEHLDDTQKLNSTQYINTLNDCSRAFYDKHYPYKPVLIAACEIRVVTRLGKGMTVRLCIRYNKRDFDCMALGLFNSLIHINGYLSGIKGIDTTHFG